MKLFMVFIVLFALSVISLLIGHVPVSYILNMEGNAQVLLVVGRIPRLISILITGMSMSVAGLIMQCLTNNKFVAPTTAGTIDGARLGILISMLIGVSGFIARTFFTFIFTLLTTGLFVMIINRVKLKNTTLVPLVGIVYGGILASITFHIAFEFNIVQGVNTWLMGSFATVLRGNYELLYVSLPLLVLSYVFADKFLIAGFGKDFSKSLGLSYNTVMNLGLVIVSLISSTILITVGLIPFIGVIIPNMISLMMGDNLKKTLPIVAISGAIFLLICDIIGRLIIHPFEVPISVTVSIIGGTIFLFLLIRRPKHA
ncbi:MAG: iron chelate uptake ABC transporter family permease subunit [Defluviitaleaceae bacterium]|nr:iron chelate uptake ABC transporter family permease subunit [Defluviitaleaceae bacterium]